MRVTIQFDSATTKQVRALSVALHQATGDNNLTLGVEGPEHWHGSTPPLTPNQFADVVGRLVRYEGRPLGDIAVGGYANPSEPCPHCNEAAVVHDGCCVHCGAPR